MAELTRKQIYNMRGALKAPHRIKAMRRRAEYQRIRYEIKIQNEIAKRVLERI